MATDYESLLATLGLTYAPLRYPDTIARIGGTVDIVERLESSTLIEIDGSDLGLDEIKNWIEGLPLDAASQVTALWPSSRFAAAIRFADFVARFDDLWFPSADDVILIDWSGPTPKMIVVSHEEHLTFGEMAGDPHSPAQ